MVVPVGEENAVQTLRLLTKEADGTVVEKYVIPVRLVPCTRDPDWSARES